MDLDTAYRTHRGYVFGLCYNHTGDPALAEDLAQDTFVRALTAWDRVQPRPGEVQYWLGAIALNLCRDRGRRQAMATRRLGQRVAYDPWRDARRADATPEQVVLAGETAAEWTARLAHLPPAVRRAVLLAAAGWDYPAIAAACQVTPACIKSRVFRGRQQLRRPS